MNLGERMIQYRAIHNISQKELARILDVGWHVVFNCENNKHKPHRANEIRLDYKMTKLEEQDVQM